MLLDLQDEQLEGQPAGEEEGEEDVWLKVQEVAIYHINIQRKYYDIQRLGHRIGHHRHRHLVVFDIQVDLREPDAAEDQEEHEIVHHEVQHEQGEDEA